MPTLFHVYKHQGGPEDGPIEDDALRSSTGFPSAEEAAAATKRLCREMNLLMLRGHYSGQLVARRPAGQEEWTFLE